MRILVAGGAGFIGSHLCDALLAMGHQVTVLDNFITGNRDNVRHLAGNPNFTLIEHDIIQPLPDVNCDVIFHLASPASPKGYMTYPLETLYVNSIGTQRLLELAERQEARFLLTSTSEVYGDPDPARHPQDESYWGNVNPVGPRSCYDEGKRFAEALTVNYAQERGVNVRIVRIFNTYGPRNHPEDGRVIPNFVTQAIAGKPLTVYGDGAQTRSFCYVSDLVEGLIRAMFSDNTRNEVINLGNPREFTIMELAEQVQALVQSDSIIARVEARPEEIARRKPDISKAKRLLGWQPTVDLENGLKQTALWFQETLAAGSSGTVLTR